MEAGSRNHEVVPTPLIAQLSGLRGGSGVHRCISTLAKTNLIAKVQNAKCMLLPRSWISTPKTRMGSTEEKDCANLRLF